MITAVGIGLGSGWILSGQQAAADAAKGPQWKDRAEYDVFEEYSKAKDGKAKLAGLDKWSKANPDSEFAPQRDEYYLGVLDELKDVRKGFEKAKELRAKNPSHYYSIASILTKIYSLPGRAAADLTTAEDAAKYVLENTDKVFSAENKPATLEPAQWAPLMAQNKPVISGLALRTNAWIWVERKDDARAEVELTKVLQSDCDQPQWSYMMAVAKMNQYKNNKDLTKVPGGIFHQVRTAVYAGPNAAQISAANRAAYLASAKSIYKQYHGSEDGFPSVEAAAKANCMPPSDFKIESITEIQTRDMQNREVWEKEHPDLAFWDNIMKGPLTGASGESVFETNFKDSLIPPGPPGTPFSTFKAKIISLTPETSPKEMTVAVFNGQDADAKLTFDPPLPGTMPLGSEIEFKGVPTAFQKDPFMVTFAIDMEEKELTGWTGTGPVNAKQKNKAAPAKPKATPAKPKGKATK